MSLPLTYAIGFLAQAFFSARIIIQWILSEKARKVLSPDMFWIFSLFGSILLFIYGWMRDDFSIILGQMLTYYIYIWNLRIKGIWTRMPAMLQWSIYILPLVATCMMIADASAFAQQFLHNAHVPMWLIILGSTGQIVFTLRFVYQWYYSYIRRDSLLPTGFWIISLAGSGMIIAYAIIRLDPVLILGQSVGFVAYWRNIMLSLRTESHEN